MDRFDGGDATIFPELTVDGRRPVVVMAARNMPVMTFGTTVLEAAGFDVRVEPSGRQILSELTSARPDLILTELLLDDMDVVHFCSLLRRHGVGRSIPLLVVSDLPHAPTIRKILEDDRTDFISTPIQWHVLVFRAHRWISLARKLTVLREREVQQEEVREARDSALKATTEVLQLRHYDSLTGLPNRELFVNTVGLTLSQQQRQGGRSQVLFLDVENFREVNDLIGRSLGDELLKVVAERLQGCLRAEEAPGPADREGERGALARFVGDQFAALLHTTGGKEVAANVAERMLCRLAEPITIGDRQFRLNGRVGIADSADLGGEGEEELTQRAETAMRYCKKQKRQRVAFFESFMNELVAQRLALTNDLRTAIGRDQLFLCYQLLMDTRTERPSGVEGLVRWQHPARGVVPPDEFLDVAEESGLVVEIDRWVLRNGCLDAKRWLDDGVGPLKISLNVSMPFLEEADFARQVLEIVEETGLPPGQLQLELSERGVLPEAGRVMSQLELLASKGIRLAIDDFGTGQTSLSYLCTLPIHCVKVDRSFVSRVPGDEASAAIVSAVGAMSHHLGLEVVAEGVETEEQSEFLRRHDYDELQGYLFSRPERREDLEARLDRPAAALPPTPAEEIWSLPALEADDARLTWPSGGPRFDMAGHEPPSPETPAPEVSGQESADTPTLELGGRRSPAMETPTPEVRDPVDAAGEGHAAQRPPEESPSYLLRLARQDFLTGLHNRFSFDERLEHAAAHADRFGHKLALLLIDLDDFKYVNDTYGHPVGDDLLVQVARRLQGLVRKVDTLARIGGDEFAVIYSEYREIDGVTEFARRLLATLAQPVQVEGRELRVKGSIGVSVYPEGQSRPKDLLRQADLALYKAKNHGGGSIHFFSREMDRDVQRSLALARDLCGALERSEFRLDYQPLVELRSGAIKGVEALLRWRHPSRGSVDPQSFIPLAESAGEIRSLGDWVLRSACEQARRWQHLSGRDVAVSVNISPVQCRDARFAEQVLRILEESDLPPSMLNLELSERLLSGLTEELEEPLRKLEAVGVGLTFDNFGSGTSALEHFRRFRFRRLKIDRSLVWSIGRGPDLPDVLSGIVALAQKINVQIVAGGIERSEEADRLLSEGCELGQGFLYSKPVAGELILDLLRGEGRLVPGRRVGGSSASGAEARHGIRLIRGGSAPEGPLGG